MPVFGAKDVLVESWRAWQGFKLRVKKERVARQDAQRQAGQRTVLDEDIDAVLDTILDYSVLDNFGRHFPLGPFRPTEPMAALRKLGLPPPAQPPLGPFGPFPIPRDTFPRAPGRRGALTRAGVKFN